MSGARPADQLTAARKEVMADSAKEKASKVYVEKKRKLLEIRVRNGKMIISGDKKSVQRVKDSNEAKNLFEQIIAEGETDDDDDFKYISDDTIEIPPLFCQVGDRKKGWNARNVEKQTVLYLNLLGAGHGGKINLKRKTDDTPRPPWFSRQVNWKKYTAPSFATIEDNLEIIKAIFEHFDLNIRTHCVHAPEEEECMDDLNEDDDEDYEDRRHQQDLEAVQREDVAQDLMARLQAQLEAGLRQQDEESVTEPPGLAHCGVAGCGLALGSWSEIQEHNRQQHGEECSSMTLVLPPVEVEEALGQALDKSLLVGELDEVSEDHLESGAEDSTETPNLAEKELNLAKAAENVVEPEVTNKFNLFAAPKEKKDTGRKRKKTMTLKETAPADEPPRKSSRQKKPTTFMDD
jgi:hypothetical protein